MKKTSICFLHQIRKDTFLFQTAQVLAEKCRLSAALVPGHHGSFMDDPVNWAERLKELGFSSSGALILDLITYINEQNDSGQDIPMPGLLFPVSPASIPVNQEEKDRLHELDSKDVMIPESYMYLAEEILLCGHNVDEKYLATAHGDFRHAPETHFYYGSSETVYAFAPDDAQS